MYIDNATLDRLLNEAHDPEQCPECQTAKENS